MTSTPADAPGGAAVETIAIGNELILGETVDTNSGWIARRLAVEGILVARGTTVGDDPAVIRDALGAALGRTRTVICTGGLGPTTDDLTRRAVAELYGRRIDIDEEWVAQLLERYRKRGVEMPAINRVQGERPQGAMLLPNARGTAPGLVLDDDAMGMTILLPGVPGEMHGLMEDAVIALLRQRLSPTAPVTSRVIRTSGLSEAGLAERVADLAAATGPVSLAFLPQLTGVDLRLTARWDPEGEGLRAAGQLAAQLRERLGACVYGEEKTDLATVAGELLRERSLTIALAESCTGGLLAKRLTDDAGASDYLQLSWVTYSNTAKREELGVLPETLAMHGAVSERCAREMADGARVRGEADVGVSVTGIAGPGGGSEDKPVGTVWIAVSRAEATIARRFQFAGDRSEIRQRSAQAALDLLRRVLLGHDT